MCIIMRVAKWASALHDSGGLRFASRTLNVEVKQVIIEVVNFYSD